MPPSTTTNYHEQRSHASLPPPIFSLLPCISRQSPCNHRSHYTCHQTIIFSAHPHPLFQAMPSLSSTDPRSNHPNPPKYPQVTSSSPPPSHNSRLQSHITASSTILHFHTKLSPSCYASVTVPSPLPMPTNQPSSLRHHCHLLVSKSHSLGNHHLPPSPLPYPPLAPNFFFPHLLMRSTSSTSVATTHYFANL